MAYAEHIGADPRRRALGVGVVAGLHVLIIWGLVSGLARHVVEFIPAPIETRIIEEVVVQPELPPPPPPLPLETPPPVFVPPPEIHILRHPPPQPIAAVTTAPPPQPAPVAQTVARVAPVVQARHCRDPDYPALSQRLGEEGIVTLSLLVGVDGRVIDSRIEQSSGYPRLDESAVVGLSRCLFTPGTVNGKPEASWARIRYDFQKRR